MKLKLSKPSVAVIGIALLIAGFGLMSSERDENGAIVASPSPHAKASADGQPTLQTPSSKPSASSTFIPSNDLSMRIDRLTARVTPEHPANDLFASSAPPAVVAPTRTARAAPAAPPFPYIYMGSLQEGSDRTVYLSGSNDRVVLAHSDQTIDGVFHIDRIDAKQLFVTYLPLKRQQTISLEHSE